MWRSALGPSTLLRKGFRVRGFLHTQSLVWHSSCKHTGAVIISAGALVNPTKNLIKHFTRDFSTALLLLVDYGGEIGFAICLCSSSINSILSTIFEQGNIPLKLIFAIPEFLCTSPIVALVENKAEIEVKHESSISATSN